MEPEMDSPKYTVEALMDNGWSILAEYSSRGMAIAEAETQAMLGEHPGKGYHVYVKTRTGVRKHIHKSVTRASE